LIFSLTLHGVQSRGTNFPVSGCPQNTTTESIDINLESIEMRPNQLLPTILLSTLFALPFAGSATATDAPTFGDYQAKGFLSDYSKIPSTPSEDGAYKYRDPNVDASKYNRLLVDRIKVWFKDDAEYKGIDPDELKMLTDYFYSAIEKAMGDDYPMVKEAGPDVLRVRIAVTDIEPNQVAASLTTLVVPFL
jgi:hypothetical protein